MQFECQTETVPRRRTGDGERTVTQAKSGVRNDEVSTGWFAESGASRNGWDR